MHKFATVYQAAMRKHAYVDEPFMWGLGGLGAAAGALGGTYVGKTIADTQKLSPAKRLAIILAGAGLGTAVGGVSGFAVGGSWPESKTHVTVHSPAVNVSGGQRILDDYTVIDLRQALQALTSYLNTKGKSTGTAD